MNANTIIAVIFMIISGFFDGYGFSHTAQIWQVKRADQLPILFKSLFFFSVGIIAFIASTHFLYKSGVQNALVMTLIWFTVTIVSLAFISGSFFQLPLIDKIIAFASIVLIGLLYYRGVV